MIIDIGLFHRLWGKAVGTQDYSKQEWITLQLQIDYNNRIEQMKGATVGEWCPHNNRIERMRGAITGEW